MPYPGQDAGQADLIRDMVTTDHVALEGTPLILALYFSSQRAPDEECVFEVLHRFGLDEVSEERSVFQIQFGPTRNFPLPEGDRLHLFLTNPNEMLYAIENAWPETNDLRHAIETGQCEVMYQHPNDPDVNRVLHALAMDAVPA